MLLRFSFITLTLTLFQIQFGKIGEKSYLKCRVVSLAWNVTIKWEKLGYLIKKETFPVHKKEENPLTSNLVVDIVDESDFGQFRCIAENEVGTSYEDINLQRRGATFMFKTSLLCFFSRRNFYLHYSLCGHRSPLYCDPYSHC